MHKDNLSGLKGVSLSRSKQDRNLKKYIATIRVCGKTHQLGRFWTADEAHEAYVRAAERMAGEFSNTGDQRNVDTGFTEPCQKGSAHK